MNHIRTPCSALTLTAALLCFGGALRPAAAQTPTPAPSLYQRLGGYDALAAVTDDFIGRLVTDSSLSRFFGGHSKNSQGRIRQLVLDQLCAVTGGPCVYIGRDMKTTHAGLGIAQADWDKSVQLLVATLNKFTVPPKEQQEVLAAVSTLKGDIVERP
jgi:hemoglobin